MYGAGFGKVSVVLLPPFWFTGPKACRKRGTMLACCASACDKSELTGDDGAGGTVPMFASNYSEVGLPFDEVEALPVALT